MTIRLTVSLVPSGLTNPLLEGELAIENIKIEPIKARSVDSNTRGMLNLDYDIAEMSLATFVKMREDGCPLVGLPIFTGRRFSEPGIGVRIGAGIHSPEQLIGRRVGIPQFWMTSSVWHRAVLSTSYGVPADAVHWVTVQAERFDGPPPADGAEFEYRADDSLARLLEIGELDAVLFPRPVAERFNRGLVECLFGDVVSAQRGNFSQTGLFPIMHFVVVQETVLSANPGLANAVIEAFERSKRRFLSQPDRASHMESPIFGMEFNDALTVFSGDAWPYGLVENEGVLTWFLDQARRQGLCENRLPLDALFAA